MDLGRRASGGDDDGSVAAGSPQDATRRLDEAELVGILAALRVAGAALERALVAAKRLEREPGPLTREFGSAIAVLATTEEDVIRVLSAPADDTEAADEVPRPVRGA